MDINTNVSQQATASLTALKVGGGKASVDTSLRSETGVIQKAEITLPGSKVVADSNLKEPKGSDEHLKKAVDDLNDFIQNTHRDLQFSIDQDSGATVVKVIDSKTEKVIRQIPNEETLKLARSLTEDKHEASLNIFSSRA